MLQAAGYRVPDKYPSMGGPGAGPNESSLAVDIIPTIFCAKKRDQNPGNEANVGQLVSKAFLDISEKEQESSLGSL